MDEDRQAVFIVAGSIPDRVAGMVIGRTSAQLDFPPPRGPERGVKLGRERIAVMLNEVGMPPAGRTFQRRRKDPEAEQEPEGPSGNPLIVSIVAFGTVLALGLALAWLVL